MDLLSLFISYLGREKVGRSMDTSYKYSEANHRATPLLGKECIWCECKEHLLFISHHLLQIESHQGGSTVIIHSTMKPHHRQEVRKYLMPRSATNLLLPCIGQQWFLLPHPLLVVSWWPEVVITSLSLMHIQISWDRESSQMLISAVQK